jgi:predicted permease
VEGQAEPGPTKNSGSSWDRVSPRFFETVGQPVIRGRGFADSDTATSQLVAVVNQAFVKKFFPNKDPIGRHFGIFEHKFSGAFEIVGIVADAKYTNPREEVRPMYFRPLMQQMRGLTAANQRMAEGRSLYINSVTLLVKAPAQNLDAMVRRTLAEIDPNLTVIDLRSLEYQVSGNFNQERLIARLTMLFGLLALVLASVGLYGITSYSVARRTSEIGVRIALGADRHTVLLLVIRNVLGLVGLGLLLGIPIAFVVGHYMGDQLYAVHSYDPVSLGIAVMVLSAAAALAGFVPARRAANLEPTVALRVE